MFIYTTRSMFPSAKALATELSERLQRRIRVTTRPETSLRGQFIRWGTSHTINSGIEINLNPANLVRVCSNKLEFGRKMVELEIPAFELRTGTPQTFPVVLRKVLNGYGGDGIEVCTDLVSWNGRTGVHYSQFRRLKPELGVHIFNGRILKIFKKMRDEGLPEEEYPIRNMRRGYHFSLAELSNYPKLIPFVRNFCEKFPIVFGRMDVGWDVENKTYRVIEFNTAPGLCSNSYTLYAYANAFVEALS